MSSVHQLCEQARNVACVCGAPPGCPCVCTSGHYHPSRFQHAYRAGLIDLDDIAFITRNYLTEVIDEPSEATS